MIRYLPTDLVKKIAPKAKVEKLVNGNLTPNKAALSMFSDIDFISKKSMTSVVLKTVKQYKARYAEERDLGATVAEASEEALAGKKLMVHRVQSAIVSQISDEIADKYQGEFFKWLPSDADEPDPEHQLNYGKTFQFGDGEKPGDRFGCRCGMDILVKDKKLAI